MKKQFILILVFLILISLVLGAPSAAPPLAMGGSQDNSGDEVQEEEIPKEDLDEVIPKPEKEIDEPKPSVNISKKTTPNTPANFIDKLEQFSTTNEDVFNPMGKVFFVLDAILVLVVLYLIYKRIKNRKK
jgi:hypothetical protein